MSTYKTTKIDELEIAAELQDGCQIPICQDGAAKKLTGAQLRAFVVEAAKEQTTTEVQSMTVKATSLSPDESATVESSVNASGTLNLNFGIPQGRTGPAGPQGKGLTISGRYDTTEDVPDPQEGENYYIGAAAPYNLYTYANGDWIDNGQLLVSQKEEILAELPITVAEDGYTDISGLRQLTSFVAVKDGDTITVTSTLQGNEVHTDVITLDAGGVPNSLVSDGVEVELRLEGFDV